MNPQREEELKKLIVKGSEVEAMRARCSRCLRMFEAGELLEGRCEPCTIAQREEVSQTTLRAQVHDRDKGVCALCRMDCLALREDLDKCKSYAQTLTHNRDALQFFQSRIHFLVRVGFTREDLESDRALWQADHVEARVRGGASNLGNARTLCLPCHRKVTGELARGRASARKLRGRQGW